MIQLLVEGVTGTPSITLLGSWPENIEMRILTTWTTPASEQTQIALTEPGPLTFVDLRPTERNTVILRVFRR
jgi:hypothetical protein